MRRYRRNPDPYQTGEKLVELFNLLKSAVYPKGAPDEEFKKLLYAVQYAERFPARNSKTGRRARFDDAFLFNSALKLKRVLHAETGGRISLLRFISTYLPVFDYPGDLRTALDKFRINLEEARILSRVNRKSMGFAVKRKPSEIRRELIDSHLKRQGTQNELRKRVGERLNLTPKGQAETLSSQVAAIDVSVDAFLEFNEFDTEHLLWEEIKGLVYLMREVDSSLIGDDATEHLLKDIDAIKLKLIKFRKPDNSE